MTPILSSISATDFRGVAAYLNHSDYEPHLLDEGTNSARLENISTPEEKSNVVVQSGTLYGLGKSYSW